MKKRTQSREERGWEEEDTKQGRKNLGSREQTSIEGRAFEGGKEISEKNVLYSRQERLQE